MGWGRVPEEVHGDGVVVSPLRDEKSAVVFRLVRAAHCAPSRTGIHAGLVEVADDPVLTPLFTDLGATDLKDPGRPGP